MPKTGPLIVTLERVAGIASEAASAARFLLRTGEGARIERRGASTADMALVRRGRGGRSMKSGAWREFSRHTPLDYGKNKTKIR
jgi:hypothetical protein